MAFTGYQPHDTHLPREPSVGSQSHMVIPNILTHHWEIYAYIESNSAFAKQLSLGIAYQL